MPPGVSGDGDTVPWHATPATDDVLTENASGEAAAAATETETGNFADMSSTRLVPRVFQVVDSENATATPTAHIGLAPPPGLGIVPQAPVGPAAGSIPMEQSVVVRMPGGGGPPPPPPRRGGPPPPPPRRMPVNQQLHSGPQYGGFHNAGPPVQQPQYGLAPPPPPPRMSQPPLQPQQVPPGPPPRQQAPPGPPPRQQGPLGPPPRKSPPPQHTVASAALGNATAGHAPGGDTRPPPQAISSAPKPVSSAVKPAFTPSSLRVSLAEIVTRILSFASLAAHADSSHACTMHRSVGSRGLRSCEGLPTQQNR